MYLFWYLNQANTFLVVAERLSWGNSAGLLARGERGSFNRQEVDSRSFGKKRDSSTSNSNHILQDRLQISVDTLENSRGSKVCLS